MSRSRRSRAKKFNEHGGSFLSTAAGMNNARPLFEKQTYFNKWMALIENLALSRFEWVGLPDSISERYLERNLIRFGQVVFFDGLPEVLGAGTEQSELKKGMVICQRASLTSNFDLYGEWEYADVLAQGDDGSTSMLSKDSKKVLCFNDMSRINTWGALRMFADDLAEIDIRDRQRLIQQGLPLIISGNKEQERDLNFIKDSFQFPVVSITGKNEIMDDISIKPIMTATPYEVEKFQQHRVNKKNEVLGFLGVEHLPVEKKGNLTSFESESGNQSLALIRESLMQPRKLACEKMNEMWGLNVSCVWRTSQEYIMENGIEEDNNEKEVEENEAD